MRRTIKFANDLQMIIALPIKSHGGPLTTKDINNGNWTAQHSASSIWNHKYDFRPKLHDTRFNYHFVTSILKSPKYDLVSSNILLMQYWASLKLNSSIFWGEKNKSFGNKGCKICQMILFVFHFPAITLVTLNKPWNLIGCFVFSVASSLAGKMVRFKAKKWCDSWINRTN